MISLWQYCRIARQIGPTENCSIGTFRIVFKHDEALFEREDQTDVDFETGEHKQIALKANDDCGNELLVVKELP